ncbi:hypothetical protein [Natrinema soli]|uniref:Uncharacterized protein n=1 Tax=Natrinema soli TaxID=1930624 RepID=A0ABD5SMD3_9EURY|nr:hypothetical protein [Natrinema soli]
MDHARNWRERRTQTLRDHRDDGRLTSSVLSAALDEIVDSSTIVVEDMVTNRDTLIEHVTLTELGSYYSSGGAGLGWAGGAAVGAKLAAPDS